MADIIQMFGLAHKLQEVIRSAKFIYGDRWQQKKEETLKVIDAYMLGKGKETRLAAAIEMSSLVDDGRLQLLLLAAAADDDV